MAWHSSPVLEQRGLLRTYYDLLQVTPVAHPEVIAAAFRALALRYHPDRPSGDAMLMQGLNAAYSVLRDPAARARYDASLQLPSRPNVKRPGGLRYRLERARIY